MRRWGTLLAVVVVFAGCSGFAGEPTRTRTVTPAPVPTAEPTPPRLAPGLNSTGVYDPAELAAAHARVLGNTSYTVSVTQTIRHPNGTLWARRVITVRLAGNESRFFVRLAVSGPNAIGLLGEPPARAVFWSADNERIFRAFTRGNHTTYNTFRPRFSPVVGRVGTADYWEDIVVPGGQPYGDIAPLFAAVETRLTDRTVRNGTTLYRIDGTAFRDPEPFARSERVGSPRNVSLRAVVDERGMVRRYRLSYAAVIDGDTVRVRRSIRYTGVGTTTVERPPWYDRALEDTPEATNATRSPRT